MPTPVHVRYGDSPTAEFVAVVDETMPLKEALRPHVRRAVEAERLPGSFSLEECQVVHEDQRLDITQPLSSHLARLGHGDRAWCLVDGAAPVAVRVLCRVDGLGRERAALRVFDLHPSRASTLEEAIRPSELLAGVKVGSIEPKRWWIKPAWPRRLWLPWGRWKRRVASLRRNDTLELVPHLKEWRCYRRPFLMAAVAVAIGLLAIILLTLTLSHNVSLSAVQAERFFLVGRSMQAVPPGKPFKARVWRWQVVWVLPRFEPLIELDPPLHSIPQRPTSGPPFTLQIQSLRIGGPSGDRLPRWRCLINGFLVARDLGELQDPIELPMGRYVIGVERPADAHNWPWNISLLGSTRASVTHEIEQRWHLLNVQPPPFDSTSESADPRVTLTVFAPSNQ